MTGTPQVGEKITQLLTVSPNAGKLLKDYVASYDKDTKVLKYFRDESLYFNNTTYDQTDYVGITTSGVQYINLKVATEHQTILKDLLQVFQVI